MLIGSCFSTHIGEKLHQYKFNVSQNPFGIVYNPKSMLNQLFEILDNKEYSEDELFESSSIWHSWSHHSQFSGTDKKRVLENMNDAIASAHQNLKTASHLFLTFGTSYVYRLKSSNMVVANCHKVPSTVFCRSLLSTEETIEEYKELIAQLKAFNSKLNIVFTVSPIRHLKDGMVENTRSKSRLIELCHALCDTQDDCFYFPSFEMLIDDLRDYRFYESDLIHPNKQGIEYVWEQFSAGYFDTNTKEILSKIKGFQAAADHNAFFPSSREHQTFLERQLEKIKRFEAEQGILLDTEKEVLQKGLSNEGN